MKGDGKEIKTNLMQKRVAEIKGIGGETLRQ